MLAFFPSKRPQNFFLEQMPWSWDIWKNRRWTWNVRWKTWGLSLLGLLLAARCLPPRIMSQAGVGCNFWKNKCLWAKTFRLTFECLLAKSWSKAISLFWSPSLHNVLPNGFLVSGSEVETTISHLKAVFDREERIQSKQWKTTINNPKLWSAVC